MSTNERPIRLLVVDDHDLFRAGIIRLVGDFSDFQVVGEASNGAEALRQARTLQPDIVLLDVDMPDADGVAVTRDLRKAVPSARVVMLTMHGSDRIVQGAVRAGAYGYLLKDSSAEELASTIRIVAGGGAVITPRLAKRMLDDLALGGQEETTRRSGRALDELSSREVEVLKLIAEGMTSREIADRLFLSEHTIKRHTSNIFDKLHVRHRSQAAAEAVRRGLLSVDAGL